MTLFKHATVAIFVAMTVASLLHAQAPAKASAGPSGPLTAYEASAVANCLAIIRGCQLPNGAFNMVNDGKQPGSPVWIAPYFVNHSMLALLAANDYKKNPADVAAVEKWLQWSVANQDAGGFWFDFTGSIGAHQSNGKVDAHDSSAALFHMVLDRFRRAGGKVTESMRAAAKRSLKCIQNVTDADGLTWAKPDYQVKYLMDNIEVYGGLIAARDLFKATGDAAEEKAAGDQAIKVGVGLKKYWQAVEPSRFAWAAHPSGAFDGGLQQMYPHGLAQLFGIAFVGADTGCFTEVVKTFKPQSTREGVGPERFLFAAARLGGADAKLWRPAVAKSAAAFTPQNVYIFRPGLAAMSLLEGADWMPSLAGGK